MRGVTGKLIAYTTENIFQLTRLMRGVTFHVTLELFKFKYFNSHASCEAWPEANKAKADDLTISTHTPHARRDDTRNAKRQRWIEISTHTPHARRDIRTAKITTLDRISTHTPHARRDSWRTCPPQENQISTHTPHARRDKQYRFTDIPEPNFNSHASCEAWQKWVFPSVRTEDISTHTPHARRDSSYQKEVTMQGDFNSHASCEAWPTYQKIYPWDVFYFNSHASCEAWQQLLQNFLHVRCISTHTPHARRDPFSDIPSRIHRNFNSHASCEAWLSSR